MDLVRALGSFFYGNNHYLANGDLYPADDPLVAAHPDWFSSDIDAVVHHSGYVEPAPEEAAEPEEPSKPGKPKRNVATQELPEVQET